MGKSKRAASVFLDANILKFSAVKKHVYRSRKQIANFGPITEEIDVYERYTINRLDKVRTAIQHKDAVLLAVLAYAGITGRLKFYYHREVELETWGLPGMTSLSGRSFHCPIYIADDPNGPYSRITSGGGKRSKNYILEFLSSIRDARYFELIKATGAYQGEDKQLNLNQALDAFYIWCAESAEIDYFLTMDYKLKRVVERSNLKTSVRILTPNQLLLDSIPKFGVCGGLKFMWKGFHFAKTNVGFVEGKGWN